MPSTTQILNASIPSGRINHLEIPSESYEQREHDQRRKRRKLEHVYDSRQDPELEYSLNDYQSPEHHQSECSHTVLKLPRTLPEVLAPAAQAQWVFQCLADEYKPENVSKYTFDAIEGKPLKSILRNTSQTTAAPSPSKTVTFAPKYAIIEIPARERILARAAPLGKENSGTAEFWRETTSQRECIPRARNSTGFPIFRNSLLLNRSRYFVSRAGTEQPLQTDQTGCYRSRTPTTAATTDVKVESNAFSTGLLDFPERNNGQRPSRLSFQDQGKAMPLIERPMLDIDVSLFQTDEEFADRIGQTTPKICLKGTRIARVSVYEHLFFPHRKLRRNAGKSSNGPSKSIKETGIFPIKKLPAELRLMIWDFIFAPDHVPTSVNVMKAVLQSSLLGPEVLKAFKHHHTFLLSPSLDKTNILHLPIVKERVFSSMRRILVIVTCLHRPVEIVCEPAPESDADLAPDPSEPDSVSASIVAFMTGSAALTSTTSSSATTTGTSTRTGTATTAKTTTPTIILPRCVGPPPINIRSLDIPPWYKAWSLETIHLRVRCCNCLVRWLQETQFAEMPRLQKVHLTIDESKLGRTEKRHYEYSLACLSEGLGVTAVLVSAAPLAKSEGKRMVKEWAWLVTCREKIRQDIFTKMKLYFWREEP